MLKPGKSQQSPGLSQEPKTTPLTKYTNQPNI